MYKAALQSEIDGPWLLIDPIRVGRVPIGGPTPDAFVTIERDGVPFARTDAFAGERSAPFEQVVVFGRFVVLGWCDVVHLIDPLTRQTRSIQLERYFDGYFSHLYPLDDRLLIAAAQSLILLDERGAILWRRGDLGIDGVVVNEVTNGVIIGEGEWDPPGGWRPFRVELSTGADAT